MSNIRAIALASALVTGAVSAPALAQDTGLIERVSPYSVEETTSRLEAAVKNAGAAVIATVDHAGSAESADMQLEPMTLIIFGKAEIGTPMLQSNPRAGLDLPIRVLIWSQAGETRVATLTPDELQTRYGIDAPQALEAMQGALETVIGEAVAKQ